MRRTLDRVRKLLAKAEGTDNEHERATFMAAASALMAKYGIESVGQADERSRPGSRIVTLPNPWAREKARLVSLVAQAVRCRPLLIGKSEGKGDGGQRVHVFGFGVDLERADLLATSLLLQMAAGLSRVRLPPDVTAVRAFRRSWMLGFTDEVYRLLSEDEARAGKGMELVLADRGAEVDQVVAEHYPRIRRSVPRTSGSGYRDGVEAGRRADLGRTGLTPNDAANQAVQIT